MNLRILLTIMLCLISATIMAGERHVYGRVTDTNGEPLIGAHIVARGATTTATTTVTDNNGKYKLTISESGEYTITISYLGYVQKSLTVPGDRDNVNFDATLEEDQATLEQVVVTGTMTPKALKDAPIATRLITASDIRKADATNIQDMLTQELPGLEFGFAMSQETSLNMSGFGGNAVLFLVDGERQAGETMDNTDYNRLNLDNVGRIEIVKGASSSLYGSNAVGGVINIISRESTQPWTLNANTRYAALGNEWRNGATYSMNKRKVNSQTSFQQTKIDAIKLSSGTSALDKALGGLLGNKIEEQKSDITELYGQETYNIKQRFIIRPNDNIKLTIRGGYFYRESLRKTYEYHFKGYSGGTKMAYDWMDGKTLELSYAYDQYDKANYEPNGTRTHDHDYRNTQNAAHAVYNHMISGRHTLTIGTDYLNDYLTTYQFVDNTAHLQNNIDAFSQYDYNPSTHLNIVGSIRYDYFSASKSRAVTGRLAAMYKWEKVSLRASYSGGFRAPSLKEMYMHFDMGNMGYMIYGNPALDPEKSNNFNLTFEHNGRVMQKGFADGTYNITVMSYSNIFDKRITTIGRWWYVDPTTGKTILTTDESEAKLYNPDGTQGALYFNEDGVTVCGIDVSMQYRFDLGLGLKYNYAYMHESGNTVDSQFTQPRSHTMTWRIDYDKQICSQYGINVALHGRNMGKPQSGRTDVDQGYTLWKGIIQNRLWEGISVNFTVDNIFDYTPEAYHYCSPMTKGRTWNAGVSVDVDKLWNKKR